MGTTILLTGLPSAGKSTVARALGARVSESDPVEVLDGDLVRREFFPELGFSKEDRVENVRRVASLARLLNRNGITAIVSMIAPYRQSREHIRSVHLAEDLPFVEVHVNAPAAICAARDVKGLYAKANRGEIEHFTGVSDPYEEPVAPDVMVRTDLWSVDQCVDAIDEVLRGRTGQAR